tara:strand:- start:611 stop:928 length:318 start_codon:yes stop_codon:yes gene_type:complete
MSVRYEWHWEKLEADGSGDIIDFNYADTLNYLFRETSYQEVKKLIDKGTHSISLQKWCGLCEDELEIVDYAYVESDWIIVAGSDFGILPKRFQKELNQYIQEVKS